MNAYDLGYARMIYIHHFLNKDKFMSHYNKCLISGHFSVGFFSVNIKFAIEITIQILT